MIVGTVYVCYEPAEYPSGSKARNRDKICASVYLEHDDVVGGARESVDCPLHAVGKRCGVSSDSDAKTA